MKHQYPPLGKKYVARTAEHVGKKGIQSLSEMAGRKVGRYLGAKLGPAAPLGEAIGNEIGKGVNNLGQQALQSALHRYS